MFRLEVELERNDGGAVANGGYAGVSLDARYKFPFVEPETAVAARILAVSGYA
jgi:hypothetical protein